MQKVIVKMLHSNKKYIPAILFLTPFFALAIEDIQELAAFLINVLGNFIVPLLIALAVVIFLWGVVKYITAGGDEEKRKEARNTMIWGIVGLFVMVAVWGFVWLLLNTFNLDTTNIPPFPTFPEL